jgi:DNA repair exonuclease SbcCD ATPase subunit
MRNLIFKYAAAYNFLPFGPDGIELHFDKYKNIVLIRGENRDAKLIDPTLPNDAEEFKISSNGTGKSSIQEIISYGLFGKTVKRPEKLGIDDVIHNKIKKDCKVELIFDNCRVVRTRMENGKKNTLRFWVSDEEIWDKDTELTQGTMATTQEEIEKRIGLSYDAFVNICIFTDDQRSCFLECDNKKKREIVENLLSLGEYRNWHENAKELRKEIKQKIDFKAKEYQLLLGNKSDAERRLSLTESKQNNWKASKKTEISNLEKDIENKGKELAATDNGAALIVYQEAQEKIKTINEKLPTIDSKKETLKEKLEIANKKSEEQKIEAQNLQKEYNECSTQAKSKLVDRKKKEAEIADLQSNEPGTRCNKCRSNIDEENINNYIFELQKEIVSLNLEIKALMDAASKIGEQTEDLKIRQKKVSEIVSKINSEISKCDIEIKQLMNELKAASQVREPKADSAEFLLQQQIEEFKNQLRKLKEELDGRSPFQDILDNDKLELENIIKSVEDKDIEVKNLERELPYYEYWISGFGDHGIRKWIVDGIVPELNGRVNYWLQFLIDNKITLKFDNELNETIERNPVDGDPYVYHAMSTGQRRRLNLAVSQSFAHIMTMSSGSIPSIVFLDEVSTNVDPLGVQGIYNMISELAEDKQVFVTTHDPDLLRMLQGADVIKLVHEDGFTKIVN